MMAAVTMFFATRLGLGAAAAVKVPLDGKDSRSTCSATATDEQEVEYWRERAAAWETESKLQEKRVQMLEREIACLIEMRGDASMSPRTPHDVLACDANLSALEELLARVLAERDLLAFRNENLESSVKEAFNRKDIRGMADRYYRHDDSGGGIVYQLSYGKHVIIGTTHQDLRTKVKEHFEEVANLLKSGGPSGTFSETTFAKSVADQCREATSERDVMQWCQKNIKVSVLRIRNFD